MGRRIGASLNDQVLITVMLLVLVILGVQGWLDYRSIRDAEYETLNRDIDRVANELAYTTRGPLYNYDNEAIRQLLTIKLEHTEFMEAVTLTHGSRNNNGFLIGQAKDEFGVAKKISSAPSSFGYYRAISRPILRDNQFLGEVQLFVSDAAAKRKLKESLRDTIIVLLIMEVALSAGILFALRKLVLVPLAKASGFAERLRQGDIGHRVDVKSSNEAGRLGETLNTMAAALETQRFRLKASESRFKALYAMSSDAVMLIQGREIMDCNKAALTMFGYTTSEDLRSGMADQIMKIPGADGTVEKLPTARTKTSGNARFEWEFVRSNGTRFPVEVLLTLIDLEDEDLIQIGIRDISDRRRAENQLRQREARIRKVSAAKERVLTSGTIEEKAKNITDSISQIFQLPLVSLWSVESLEPGAPLIKIACSGESELLVRCEDRLDGDGYLGGFIGGHENHLLANELSMNEANRLGFKRVKTEGLKAFTGHRLISSEGQLIGLMAAFSRERISSDDDVLITDLAETSAHVIQASFAAEQLEAARSQLFDTARKIGRAEIATGVLHNVGNVLNSINVAATDIRGKIKGSQLAGLKRLAELLEEHKDQLAKFLTETEQGRKLPVFVKTLSAYWEAQQEEILDRMMELEKRIDHVNRVIHIQQGDARAGGAFEQVAIDEVINDAIVMCSASLGRRGIRVDLGSSHNAEGRFDRHRIIQVLINLITNAQYALDKSKATTKSIEISTELAGDERIAIHVADNGVGISAENMEKLFQRGFTTKENGHGFGLHHCSRIAVEMGGRLRAESAGEGMGAMFTLELPTVLAETNEEPLEELLA